MNWFLASPELSLAGLAVALVLLDLVVAKKGVLAALSVLALLVAMGLGLSLWGEAGSTAFNRMLIVDEFAIFFKVFFPAMAILVVLSSVDYVARFQRSQGEYYALVLIATLGMMLMAATGELITIYIALEVVSISFYIMAGFLKETKSAEAGLKYLLLGAVASAVLLYGMALLYGLTGTTHLGEIAAVIGTTSGPSPALIMGLVFLVAGFGFKMAMVPFHMWVPDVYEGAPTPVTAYLAVGSKAAAFAVTLRVFYVAFGAPDWLNLDWGLLFAVLSAVTMTVGNIMALPQANIKRLLAYSSIAHAGYILVGLAVVGVAPSADILGRNSVLFYLAAYGLMTMGAFVAITAISNRLDSDMIDDYAGMARRSPWLAMGLAFTLISLIGLPPTAGFVAKIFIFNAAVQHDLLWLVIIAVLNTVVSAYYYLRVVKAMYLGAPPSTEAIPSSPAVKTALALCCLGVLGLGIAPAALLRGAELAVRIFGGT